MGKSKNQGSRDVPAFDAALGRRSFEELEPQRKALGHDVDPAPRLPMDDVAILGVAVGNTIKRADVRARFRDVEKALPADVVDRVEKAAWALWHATRERASASAKFPKAMVPSATIEAATVVRQRMLHVLNYRLDGDTTAKAELADIASGNGYSDLASDLDRLAQLYDDYRDDLKSDTHRYQTGDAGRARELAKQIVESLGASEDRTWTDAVNRSYAVLDETYAKVRAFGLALFLDQGGTDMFPSLFSVRASPTREPAEAPAGGGGGGDGGVPTPLTP
jgi:hypothetical protein